MDKLTGDEREFYIDQQATRIGSLSKEIDTEFAIEEQQEEEQELKLQLMQNGAEIHDGCRR
ncbi:Hypothetical protein FKW44_025278 [Caligus rogercresseyi]|uniref:Uncharacterized protein n=1 Tax=Caligus rogercresseyi TaxID=217165 RepID=A0A7T8JSF1_CALRO|nr:Hypothetical protein FKW44_025278 [Caligus rogercresseyi]